MKITIKNKVLYHFPPYLQNLVSYLFLRYCVPLQIGPIKYLRFSKLLKQSQWWPRQKLEQYQAERLKQLLRYAYSNIPYYTDIFRKLNLRPEDFNSIEDLQRLPVLTKEDVVNEHDKLISRKVSKRYLKLVSTSGSTGKPMRFFRYAPDIYTNYSLIGRHEEWRNIKKGVRNIQLWSRPFIEEGVNSFYLYHPFENRLSLSTLPYSFNVLNQYIELIKQFNPIFILGNPSMLYHLACYAQENNIKYIRFRYFISKFENIFPYQKLQIEKQFKCRVFNSYGSEERVISAFQCPTHEGMHIMMEQGVLEILDDKAEALPEGHSGRMVATGLYNYAMPFIRYDTGDFGSISEKPCPCGRGLLLLKSFDGRANEVLRYGDKIIYSTTLSVIIWNLPNIKECQFVQESDNELRVNIVKRKGYSEKDTQELIKTLRDKIAQRLSINIKFLDHIPRTRMGKFPFIISKS